MGPCEAVTNVPCMLYLETRLAFEWAARIVDAAIVVKDRNELQTMPFPGCKVIGVMRRGDFDCACPKRHIHQLSICDDRDEATANRVHNALAME